MRLNRAIVGAALFAACASAAESGWNNPPKGRIQGLEHKTFRSTSMRADVGYNICLPPEYAREAERRFPVIYYLHGYEGNESSFPAYSKYWRDSLRRTGPTILVFVNGGETSFFSDAPTGSIMGETVVKELVMHVDSEFRTQANSRGRSVHGYSMGGFGALKFVLKYPDLFASAVTYGATISDAQQMQKHLGKIYRQMFGSADRFAANDPLALAQNADKARGQVSIMTIIGTRDEFLDGNRELRDRLNAAKLAVEYVELAGVKHAKEPLFEHSAARAFDFSAKAFPKESSAQEKKDAR